jgi:hypothetical protein
MTLLSSALHTSRGRRRLSQAYALAAALLVPWIVVLFLTQRYTGTVKDLTVVTVGVPTAVIAGLLGTARLYATRSPKAAVTATFTAAAIFIMEWFHLLTGTSPSLTASFTFLALLLPILGLLIWVAVRSLEPAADRPAVRQVPWLLVVLAVIVASLVAQLAADTASVHSADHLRLVWTGLDCFEFLGLAAIAWGLRTGSARTVIAGAYTAALLLSDAWFNVAASLGAARLEAIAMTVVEVPIAVVSLVIAWQEAGRAVHGLQESPGTRSIGPVGA